MHKSRGESHRRTKCRLLPRYGNKEMDGTRKLDSTHTTVRKTAGELLALIAQYVAAGSYQ